MKKKFFSFSALLLAFSLTVNAQVKVAEPEFVGSYCLLTSDSTASPLPKEIGQLKEHKTKAEIFSKVASAVGSVGTSVGVATMGLGGSVGAITTGARVISTAGSVESIGSAVGVLSSASGMDIVLDGKGSYCRAKTDDVRILIKAEENNVDPADLYRIVAFKPSKKERRMQWFDISSALLGSDDAKGKGYIPFSATKYDTSSYFITIPASALPKGEYGIVAVNGSNLQVATFGID